MEIEDHAIILVAESKTQTAPWTGEARITHGRRQEADTETTREKPRTYTSLRAIDNTIAMIHARDMDKDTILENVGRSNEIDRFDLSHQEMPRDKTAKTNTLTAKMHKTNLNHHTKQDNMT